MNRQHMESLKIQLDYIERDLENARMTSIAGRSKALKFAISDYKWWFGSNELTDILEFLENPYEIKAKDIECLKITLNEDDEEITKTAEVKRDLAIILQVATRGRVCQEVRYKLEDIINYNERAFGIIRSREAVAYESNFGTNPYQE